MGDLRVDVAIEDPEWTALVSDPSALAERALAAAAEELADDLRGAVDVSVVFTSDDAIRRLNRDHRGRDRPTNVLSFPLEAPNTGESGNPAMIGDIVLAARTVAAEAADQGKTVDRHVCHLLIHGMLHLVGFDHEQDDEAVAMECREVAALRRLGIADPYRLAQPEDTAGAA